MWHRQTKWADTVGKMALIDLLTIGLSQTFNLLKEKKKHYLWSMIKQSARKQGMPVLSIPPSHGKSVTVSSV